MEPKISRITFQNLVLLLELLTTQTITFKHQFENSNFK